MFDEAINKMVEDLKSMTSKMIDSAPFDKSYRGMVVGIDASKTPAKYTVRINGADKVIKSHIGLNINDYVVVLVPNNNWERATILYTGTGDPSGSSATLTQELLSKIYPVGSIYMSVNNVSPELFIGGRWEQIQDRFLLSAGNSYGAGTTGGEATHTLSVDETPTHTHTRGTMNITGKKFMGWQDHGAITLLLGGSGYAEPDGSALYATRDMNPAGATTYYNNANSSPVVADHFPTLAFDASRSWTGETSSVGLNGAHNNMPPYLTVYMWKRIN